MIRQLFDPRGRLTGSQYAVAGAMQFCGCVAFSLLAVAVVSVTWYYLHLPKNGFVLPLAILLGSLFMWTDAAVTAKRWRDLGINPVGGVLGLWLTLWLGDQLLHALHAGRFSAVWLPLSSYLMLCRLGSSAERRPPSSSETLEPRLAPRRAAFGLRR